MDFNGFQYSTEVTEELTRILTEINAGSSDRRKLILTLKRYANKDFPPSELFGYWLEIVADNPDGCITKGESNYHPIS